MICKREPLSGKIVARKPLGLAGASGNTLERLTLGDGRRLVRKEVRPRGTGSRGRPATTVASCVRRRSHDLLDLPA